MAAVWAGHDELLARRVAIKCLDPLLARDEGVRARFRGEAVAAAGLTHPHIVTTFDTGEDADTAFIVMEIVEGESLRGLLDRRTFLDPSEAIAIGRAVADALEHAHGRGLVHRDVKPGNVLVPRTGLVKVTDFGIAKAIGAADMTRTGTVVGTARYLSPEQVRGMPADPRSDVYALGLVLYEMLAGQPAFTGETEIATASARLAGPPPTLGSLRPGLSSDLVDVVDAALEPDPDRRIESARALGEALRRASVAPPRTGVTAVIDVGAGTNASPPTPPPRSGRATGSVAASPPPPPPAASPLPSGGPVAPASSSAAPRSRRWSRRLAFIALLAILGVAAALITRWAVGDHRSARGSAVAIASAADFDPFGDNHTENPTLVPLAVDGDPGTSWHSESYFSRDVGGKGGVGLVLSLSAPSEVRSVRIVGAPGAAVEVRVADAPANSPEGWGPVRARVADTTGDDTLTLTPLMSGRSVLLWFTRTPASGTIAVAEVEVR